MKNQSISLLSACLICGVFLVQYSCSNPSNESNKNESQSTVYPSDVIPFFDHWNLILGDGSNAGQAINLEHEDFFYTSNFYAITTNPLSNRKII